MLPRYPAAPRRPRCLVRPSTLAENQSRCDGKELGSRRRGANRDDGINADLLRELLAPQEDERRASGSAEIGMWLDNLDKFQSMKRKMVPGEAGAEEIDAKIRRIQAYVDSRLAPPGRGRSRGVNKRAAWYRAAGHPHARSAREPDDQGPFLADDCSRPPTDATSVMLLPQFLFTRSWDSCACTARRIFHAAVHLTTIR